MTSRYDNIQRLLAGIDEYGCFFLSLLSIAEEYNGKPVDLIGAVRWSAEHKVIDGDYTVLDDCALLAHLTGKKVSKRAGQECGVLKGSEYSIEKWYNPATGYHHFKRRYFDVFHDGRTVREGYMMCYYIYTIGEK